MSVRPNGPINGLDDALAFMEYWLGPREPGFGVPRDHLPPMPAPLRRFYEFAGNWTDSHGQSVFLHSVPNLHPPEHLTIDREGMLVFASYLGEMTAHTLTEGEDALVLEDHGESVKMDPSLSNYLARFSFRNLPRQLWTPMPDYEKSMVEHLEGTEPSIDARWMHDDVRAFDPAVRHTPDSALATIVEADPSQQNTLGELFWIEEQGEVLVRFHERTDSWDFAARSSEAMTRLIKDNTDSP